MKYIKYLSLIAILIIALSLCLQNTFAESLFNSSDYKNDFIEANNQYKNHNYYEAITNYNKIINKGINNGSVYYNLGNAYLKNDQIGKAILSYKKALKYQPRNPDIKTNLQFALDGTKDQFSTEETVEPILHILAFWYYNLNTSELVTITIIINFILCIGVIINLFYSNNILKITNYVVLTMLLILFSSSIIKIYNNNKVASGVVIVKETDIKSGYGYDYSTLYKLHEGSVFKITENKDDWYKILLTNGQKGWINKDSIGVVKSDS
ncbi:MAG: tetratricopeptide repeat protein [Vampirovibrionia bacterium]